VSPDELDNELEELENRLERLRALYDQYFLGIEKIEPTVARKDVDRRIWMLRREQIRNTGRRFRLQTLVMRYNTFQQYWQRICREIENGTYTRHMLRAERTFGETAGLTIAARKRLGMFRRGAEKRDERERRSDGSSPPDSQPPPEPAAIPEAEPAPAVEQSAAIPRPKLDDLDLDMDFFAALEAPEPPAPVARAAAPAATRAPGSPAARPPVPPAARPPAPQTAATRAPAPAVAPPPPGLGPPAPPAPLAASAAQRSAALPPVQPAAARAGLLSRLGAKPPPPAAAPPPPKPAEASSTGEARRASTPPPAAAAGLSRPAADRAARLAPSNSPSRQAPVATTPAASVKAPAESSGVARVPQPAAPTPERLQPPPAEQTARRDDKAQTPARSAPKNPAPRKETVAAKPSPGSSPKAAPKPAGVTDERIRELHGRLVDAKRQVNDAGKITVDGLTKSLRAAESRLRQQHGDRRIDFDVVIKDGKAVVKPILR
jgi:hypothetical protein